jgi:hypothetical protein
MASKGDMEKAFEKGEKDGQSFRNSDPVSELINPSYNAPSDKDVKGSYDDGFKTGKSGK